MITVLKFGGTCVGNGANIKATAAVVRKAAERSRVAVVVSAMSGVSSSLLNAVESAPQNSRDAIRDFVEGLRKRHIEACEVATPDGAPAIIDLINCRLDGLTETLLEVHERGLSAGTKDMVAAIGEKLSAPIVSGAIAGSIPSEYYYGDDGLIITDDNFMHAEPLMELTGCAIRERLLPTLERGIVPVITGFMGCTRDGRTTILGRGSSDYISAILGACLDADEIQIWTDVDGLLSANPEVVDNPRLIERISFNEASEMAYFGAEVLHPKTLLPAMQKNIPIRTLNLMNPGSGGTLILKTIEKQDRIVTGVTAKRGITLVEIISTKMLEAYGFLSRIFEIFSKYGVSIDMVSTTEVSVSLTIDRGYEWKLDAVVEELQTFARVKVLKDRALVCVIGEGMKSVPGIAGRIFSCMGKNNINVECISQGALEINISFVIDNSEADRAVKLLHGEFF